jgi:uncharacterized metal-binding protein YceD (DUF177 family)
MKVERGEFSRPLQVDRIPAGGSEEAIFADPVERDALAARLDLPAVYEVSARFKAEPWRGGGVRLEGRIIAEFDQLSVVSLEAFRQRLELPVLRYFLPAGAAAPEADDDIDVIEGGSIDLGEIAAETIALELDPYPRKPGETFESAGDGSSSETSPFAALPKLKPRE